MPQAAATNQAMHAVAKDQAGGEAAAFGMEPLTPQELSLLDALLDDIAGNENVRQDDIRAKIEEEFGIDHLSNILRRDFRHVIEFLDDLRFDGIRSKR